MGAACCSDNGGKPVPPSEVQTVQAKNQIVEPVPALSASPPKEEPKDEPKEEPAAPPPPKVAEPVPEPVMKAAATMTLQFTLPDGSEQSKEFIRKPLGLDFEKKMPITMKRVRDGGVGQELGIELGWIIKKVGEDDITSLPFVQAYDKLKQATADLSID